MGSSRVRRVGLSAAVSLSVLLPAAGADATVPTDGLVVAPGRIGTWQMGTRTSKARAAGWIRRDRMCGNWTAGPKAYKLTPSGDELYKAYPVKVRGGRVLSAWATGEVVTTKGVRTDGLHLNRRAGSRLAAIRAAYPRLRARGAWRDPASGLRANVYTAGGARRGFVDFFMRKATGRLWFVVVRTDDVSWRFKGADGC